jgi:hypothetical protein
MEKLDDELLVAARSSDFERVKVLLAEGGATTQEKAAYDVLLKAEPVRWIVKNGGIWVLKDGSSAFAKGRGGEAFWNLLERCAYSGTDTFADQHVIALLRALLLRSAPPPTLMIKLSSAAYKNEFKYAVKEGNRLRERLPEYLEQRRVLLIEHSPLIPPLRALVHDFEEPRRTFDLWATGLGADSQHENPAKRRRKAEINATSQLKRPHFFAREYIDIVCKYSRGL